MVLPKSLVRFIAMSRGPSSISSNLINFKIPVPFHSSAKTEAFSQLKMPQARQTPKPISISAHWVPNHPPDPPSKPPAPPEFPPPPQIDPPSMPPEVPGPPNVPEFNPIPPADPPPVSPGPNPGPDFPGPPMPSPPPTPDAPRPPIPSPPGPDLPKCPPDVYPPDGPDIVPRPTSNKTRYSPPPSNPQM